MTESLLVGTSLRLGAAMRDGKADVDDVIGIGGDEGGRSRIGGASFVLDFGRGLGRLSVDWATRSFVGPDKDAEAVARVADDEPLLRSPSISAHRESKSFAAGVKDVLT